MIGFLMICGLAFLYCLAHAAWDGTINKKAEWEKYLEDLSAESRRGYFLSVKSLDLINDYFNDRFRIFGASPFERDLVKSLEADGLIELHERTAESASKKSGGIKDKRTLKVVK